MKTFEEFLKDEYFDLSNENQTLKAKIAMKKYTTQLLSDYTDKIVENVYVDNNHQAGAFWDSEDFQVNKESITKQLPEFLKTII